MRQRQINERTVELMPDEGKSLRRKEDGECLSPGQPVLVLAGNEESWEETDSVPQYTEEEYRSEVERLIALRYTTGQEIQFAREREEAGGKYAEYLAYVESCKARAAASLAARATGEEEPPETPAV